jgi:hypothetical protein
LLHFGHVHTVGRRVVVELVGHDNEVAFRGILVCLELVIYRLVAGAAREQEEEFGGRVRVVGGFGNVAVDATKLGELARGFLAGWRRAISGAVILRRKYIHSSLDCCLRNGQLLTPMVGPSCALESPGKTLCSTAGSTGFSCASLSGARVALSLSAMVFVYCE